MNKTNMLVIIIGMIQMSCSKKKDDNSIRDLSILGFLSSSSQSMSSSSNLATLQVQGTLKDSSGNPIANATLTLGVSQNILPRIEVTTSTTTDSNGNYTLNLKVGKFSVKVTNSSGVEIGSFSLNATSTTTKPEVAVESGNLSPVVNSVAVVTSSSEIPSNLSYTSSSVVATVGTAITSLSPTVTGTVTSYTISPGLPSGLSINSTSGVISGTPASLELAKSYTITASNSAGNTTFVINISVGGCGKYANQSTLVYKTDNSNTPYSLSCSFDITTFKSSCTITGTNFVGVTIVTDYNSKFDYVKQLLTIGLNTQSKNNTIFGGGGGTCTTTFTYDTEGKIVSSITTTTNVNNLFCSTGSSTFSNYDSKGRPQIETTASGDISYVYDDAQKKVTTSGSGYRNYYNSDLIEIENTIFSISNIQSTEVCTP